VLTSGATHGLHLILSTLLDMTAIIFVDEVTYMIALEAFAQFSGMQIVTGTTIKHFSLNLFYKKNSAHSSSHRPWCRHFSVESSNHTTQAQVTINRKAILGLLLRNTNISQSDGNFIFTGNVSSTHTTSQSGRYLDRLR
jgi:hypothetical protein